MTQAALPEYAFEQDKAKLETKQPAIQDLHIDVPLQNVSLAYRSKVEAVIITPREKLPEVQRRPQRLITLED